MTKSSLIALLAALSLTIVAAQAQEISADLSAPSLEAPVDPTAADSGLTLSPEQTAEFRRIVVEQGARPAAVDFEVAVGASVPATLALSSLPAEIAALIPDVAGYFFALLPDGRIMVVSPNSLKVALIL